MSMGFKLSYLYLDKYRTIEEAHVSFDHRYIFVQGTDGSKRIEFELPAKRRLASPYFYGDHIYSMSCIVGRNGEGKSSTVDFIHECFLLMLRHINEGLLEVNGDSFAVANLDTRRAFYHLEENTEFMVIFTAGKDDYFLTNIPYIENNVGIKAFTGQQRDIIDLERYCMAYFSQMRFRSGVASSELQRGRSRDALALPRMEFYDDNDDNPYLTTEELFGRYKVDFSEERINARRSLVKDVNFDILIQLVFIYLRSDLVSKCLGDTFMERMRINSINYEGGDSDNDSMLSDAIDVKHGMIDKNMISRIVRDPQSYLRPFSSGQYTRFALLARLFWFLAGSKSFSETPFPGIFEDKAQYHIFEERFLNRKIAENTGALLLFDEGDLFYHPEWQREFVGDIIDLVKTCAGEDMQIVFTTNSPFMMSDMLREDIVTLTRGMKDIAEDVLTFGQNIHTLLAHRFFLDSTIGSVSESVIGWLISLLADPGPIIVRQEKYEDPKKYDLPGKYDAPKEYDDPEEYDGRKEYDAPKKYDSLEEKRNSIRIYMKKEGLSKARAEARYVNRKVFERYRDYSTHREWDELSDKSEFLEALISSIGEEIYRKRLSYRFALYRERTLEKSVVITAETAERLLNKLKNDPNYWRDPAVSELMEHLQKKS